MDSVEEVLKIRYEECAGDFLEAESRTARVFVVVTGTRRRRMWC